MYTVRAHIGVVACTAAAVLGFLLLGEESIVWKKQTLLTSRWKAGSIVGTNSNNTLYRINEAKENVVNNSATANTTVNIGTVVSRTSANDSRANHSTIKHNGEDTVTKVHDVPQQTTIDINHTKDAPTSYCSRTKGRIGSAAEAVIKQLNESLVIADEDCDHLPDWDAYTKVYGSEPVILGTETCQAYRDFINKHNAEPRPRIAGMYNTGTNAYSRVLEINVNGMRDIPLDENTNFHSVPWDKHAYLHQRYEASHIEHARLDDYIMPIVLIRDPYRWFTSMCKAPYDLKMNKTGNHCPILVPTKADIKKGINSTQVVVKATKNGKYGYTADSIAHLWSSWYREYLDTDIPRLVIRYEDTIMHAEQVYSSIAECVGLEKSRDFLYYMDMSKKHGHGGNFIRQMFKNADVSNRYTQLTTDDLEYARRHLDKTLMDVFHY